MQLIFRQSIYIFVLALFCCTSCKKSFLRLPAQGALDEAVLKNAKGVNAVLIGAYAALDGGRGLGYNNCGTPSACVASLGGGDFTSWDASVSNFLFGSIAGGEAHKGAGAGSEIPMAPFQRWNSMTPSNPYINIKWRLDYEGIARANSVLRILGSVTDMSDDEKKSIEGQARVIRGHFYFDLKKNFGMVPWIDETTTDYTVPNDKDIYSNIEEDFKFGLDNLPEVFPEVGRINKWAAAAYLAKTYLFEGKYQEAKATFDQVIASGVTSKGVKYALTAKFHDNFDAATENNSESVFVVQMVGNDGTNDVGNSNSGDLLNYPTGLFPCCGIFIPSQDLVNSYRTDGDGLPLLDNYNSDPIKSDQGLSSSDPFTPDQGNIDPRLDYTVGRRGIPYLDWGVHPGKDWIRDQAEAGPYSPIKNVHMQATQATNANYSVFGPGNGNNLNYIRYADVLLLAAEAEAQLGNLAVAEAYVNQVRDRAANAQGWVYKYLDDSHPLAGVSATPAANYKIASYPAGTFEGNGKDFSLKAIYFERKLELALEGHRYYDLSRWGLSAAVLNSYFLYESPLTTDLIGAKFQANKNEVYPIPQVQIDLTVVNGKPTLQQNKGY